MIGIHVDRTSDRIDENDVDVRAELRCVAAGVGGRGGDRVGGDYSGARERYVNIPVRIGDCGADVARAFAVGNVFFRRR